MKLKIFYGFFILCWFYGILIDYDLLNRIFNNMSIYEIIHYLITPFVKPFFYIPVLLLVYSYKDKLIWFFILMISMFQWLVNYFIYDKIIKLTSDVYLFKIFIISIIILIISILIIKKIKLRLYLKNLLILFSILLFLFFYSYNANNDLKNKCLNKEIEIYWCKEHYSTDYLFYEKLLKLDK